MPSDAERLLAAGRDALAAGDWPTARSSFQAVVEQEDVPEALAGLSDALWWLGETDAAVRSGERAYATFRRRPDPMPAALASIGLYFLYRVSLGNTAAARGWLGRTARLVEQHELAPLAGWVLLLRAHDTDDAAAAAAWALQACELARRFADADLELCALSQRGAALVQAGELEEGVALLDEAMAGSLAGECRRLQTVVYTSCNTISACCQVAELERITQWVRAADEFHRRYGSAHLFTHCRANYGGVLFATGDWDGAERELDAALRIGRSAERALYGEALARLAELRLAQGRLDEAERLLDGYEDHVTSAWVLAALQLARGDPAAAARGLRRRVTELDEHERSRPGSYRAGAASSLEEAALLEAVVVAEVELGDAEAARAAAERIGELGAATRCRLVVARGQRALGISLGACGDADAGRARLERALMAFRRLEMPLEVARTRLLLARALPRDAAVAEARAALAGLEALGAARDADAAAALLRDLGVRASRGGRAPDGELTRREREVLELLAEGLSNRELAERLFITRKTVEHHVHSVYRKLGLRGRAEAAAYAVRHLDGDRDV